MKQLTEGCSLRNSAVCEPKTLDFEIEGRKFSYDCNSMKLFQLEEGESITGADRVPQFPFTSWFGVSAMVLEATHACHNACRYCFVDLKYDDHVHTMKLDTALRAITYFFPRPEKGFNPRVKAPHIGFFGGEPLLNWPLIDGVTGFLRGYCHPIRPSLGMTTSAVLMTEERAKYLTDHGYSFIVSLDGPKDIHDAFRPHKDGDGTYDRAIQGIKYLNDAGTRNITLRGTFTADCVRLLDRVVHLNELCDVGMGNWASVEPADLSEHACVKAGPGMVFTPETVRALESEYMACAKWFVERVKNGKKVRFHQLYKTVERLLYGFASPNECGAGRAYIGIGPTGSIHACHRENNSYIGHMDKGWIDEALRAKWVDNRGIYTRPKCVACPIRFVCGSGCRESSLGDSGDITIPNVISCEFWKLFFKAAVWVVSEVDKATLMTAIPMPQGLCRPKIGQCKGCVDKGEPVEGSPAP